MRYFGFIIEDENFPMECSYLVFADIFEQAYILINEKAEKLKINGWSHPIIYALSNNETKKLRNANLIFND